ncbi:hypothetical protein SUDANB25_01595 [Streptomyces sp. SudanB25_2051]
MRAMQTDSMSTLPSLATGRSSHASHLCSRSSKMKSRKIISRNIPPKAAMAAWASVTSASYCFGWSSASCTASIGPTLALIATMTTGKTSRIPNTAIRMPIVRKIFCQKAFIFLRIPALTTALSKEREISRIDRISTIPNASHPHCQAANARPSAVTANDQPKVFRTTDYPIVLGVPPGEACGRGSSTPIAPGLARTLRRALGNIDPEV